MQKIQKKTQNNAEKVQKYTGTILYLLTDWLTYLPFWWRHKLVSITSSSLYMLKISSKIRVGLHDFMVWQVLLCTEVENAEEIQKIIQKKCRKIQKNTEKCRKNTLEQYYIYLLTYLPFWWRHKLVSITSSSSYMLKMSSKNRTILYLPTYLLCYLLAYLLWTDVQICRFFAEISTKTLQVCYKVSFCLKNF